ncbi:MAG: hypothetical protein LBP36_00735 [Oscillospiraceae bacterium]|jgi:hypothetical protein|nr:hypothetical protein [Oscillospiraceae bacterium]
MNIFNKESVFLGEHPFEALSEATKEIFKLAKEIKKSLAEQGYLLDNYLSMILESANDCLAQDAAITGFEGFSDLFAICTAIQGEHFKDKTSHPFYKIAKKYVEENSLKFQEKSTVRDLYCAALADEFITFALKKFIEKEKDELREVFEAIQLQEYHSKIAYLVGEEKISRLAELLKSRFLIARPVNIFLQAMTNQLLYCLTKRDKETSKQVFQLILDEK